ncbi:hypothetical protein PRLR6025_01060 [Prevotella lacticifex]|uniref:VanZ family protein n=1 Tax=Prevotella lacticifex TaxID=2854755 RepID=UPI001CC4FBAC|nr:VanZ family protein [Prevotella lacticifex]GJG64272.1 hypothetical protein PRLR6014_07480 [Prevotella lacticifex]GJG66637.1 hypothetical protein PRLR6025_01060 [Prevotella lacticifex]
MRNFIRNYPLSLLFTVFIWVICLIPIPETPLDNVHLIDKWTHIALYFLLSSIIGHEFFMAQKRAQKKPLPRQLLLWEWLLPVAMGGLVEIVQATCTGGVRNGDWFDFLADAIGSTVALLIGCILLKVRK